MPADSLSALVVSGAKLTRRTPAAVFLSSFTPDGSFVLSEIFLKTPRLFIPRSASFSAFRLPARADAAFMDSMDSAASAYARAPAGIPPLSAPAYPPPASAGLSSETRGSA